MAAIIVNNTPGKRSEQESLSLLAGSNACRLVKASEVFSIRAISHIISNEDGSTITSLLADDKPQTEVGGNTDSTDLNVIGSVINKGSVIVPQNYELSRGFSSVSCGLGSFIVYYSQIPNNN
ncbi:MAG: hypothetical protein ACW972_08200 [Promethearchaeota archaeon]|jgi:hypothetical protein